MNDRTCAMVTIAFVGPAGFDRDIVCGKPAVGVHERTVPVCAECAEGLREEGFVIAPDRDDAVDGIVDSIHPMPTAPGTMASYHTSVRDNLRRAVQAGRELGWRLGEENLYEVMKDAKAEGAREAYELAAQRAENMHDEPGWRIAAAIRARGDK